MGGVGFPAGLYRCCSRQAAALHGLHADLWRLAAGQGSAGRIPVRATHDAGSVPPRRLEHLPRHFGKTGKSDRLGAVDVPADLRPADRAACDLLLLDLLPALDYGHGRAILCRDALAATGPARMAFRTGGAAGLFQCTLRPDRFPVCRSHLLGTCANPCAPVAGRRTDRARQREATPWHPDPAGAGSRRLLARVPVCFADGHRHRHRQPAGIRGRTVVCLHRNVAVPSRRLWRGRLQFAGDDDHRIPASHGRRIGGCDVVRAICMFGADGCIGRMDLVARPFAQRHTRRAGSGPVPGHAAGDPDGLPV